MFDTDDLTTDIRTERSANSVRFILPRREIGKWRLIGLLPILFGLFILGFLAFWFHGFTGIGSSSSSGPPVVFIIIAGVFALPFLFGVWKLLFFGLAVLFGHAEMEVTDQFVLATERVGPLRRRGKRPIHDIHTLRIKDRLERRHVDEEPIEIDLEPAGFKNLRAIFVEGGGKKPMMAAVAYPRGTCIALAQLVSEEIEARTNVRTFEPPESPGKRVTTGDNDVANEPDSSMHDAPKDIPLPEPPADTDITIERNEDGITITIPPAGFFKGSKGLGCMAVFWNLFIVIFGVFTVAVPLVTGNANPAILPFLGGTLLFGAIGVGIFLGALNMGKRQAILDVVNDTLLVNRSTIRGLKQAELSRSELRSIRVGRSGMEVNDVPVMELHIVPKAGKKLGMLSQRSDEELEWIAAELRRALRLER